MRGNLNASKGHLRVKFGVFERFVMKMFLLYMLFLILCGCAAKVPGSVTLRQAASGQWEVYEITVESSDVRQQALNGIEDKLNSRK